MKKILFLILMCVIFAQSYGQERDKLFHSDTLISGTDSIYVDTLYSKYRYVTITVQDTGSVFTDSLQVETLDPVYSVWTPIGVTNLIDGTDDTLMIAGAGKTRKFLVLDPNIYIIRVRLINAEFINKRGTLISIMAKNY